MKKTVSTADRKSQSYLINKYVESCAACGLKIEASGNDWVVLASGHVIHYGGRHALHCYDIIQKKTAEAAKV